MQALLSEWGPSDSRGVALLIALALAAAIAGFVAYFETQDVRWAFGAVVIDRKLALRLLRHGAAQQPDPLAARRRSRRGARARPAMGHGGIGPDRDRRSWPCSYFCGRTERRRLMGRDSPRRCDRDIAESCAFSPACAWASQAPALRSTLTASPGRRRSPGVAVGAHRRARACGSPRSRPAPRPPRRRSRRRRSSPRPARCTRTASRTSPTASAAARRARGSSRSCATAASAPMARSRLRSR